MLPRKHERRQDAGATELRRRNIQKKLYTRSNHLSSAKWDRETDCFLFGGLIFATCGSAVMEYVQRFSDGGGPREGTELMPGGRVLGEKVGQMRMSVPLPLEGAQEIQKILLLLGSQLFEIADNGVGFGAGAGVFADSVEEIRGAAIV